MEGVPAMSEEHYMELALKEAENALAAGEVPVGCVFVRNGGDCNTSAASAADSSSSREVLATGFNRTNETRNGTRHAELVAMDDIILRQKLSPDVIRQCDLYVTCEPCIMCAAALGKMGIRSVTFGCGNDRFGGNGSILSVHCQTAAADMTPYPIRRGVLEARAIEVFQRFYCMENNRAPQSKRRKKQPATCTPTSTAAASEAGVATSSSSAKV